MKIAWGHTRIAFVFPKYTVKVPRVRWIQAVRAFILTCRGRYVENIVNEKFRRNPFMVLLIFLFSGFAASRREYFFSKRHPISSGDPVVPVYWISAMHLVEIQQTGRELSDIEWERLRTSMAACKVAAEIVHRDDFSVCRGMICVHDCGSRATAAMLESGGLRRMREMNAAVAAVGEIPGLILTRRVV